MSLRERARGIGFDSWLLALMLAGTGLAVAAGLYVSYTALRYVAEEIGGMPANVSVAFPLTIDAAVAAGLFGEWWLAGRRQRERLAFAYMLGFGLVFAGLTVGGNALHGALALSVQRPVELHVGGRLVPLPWWISIAVSAVPGLAIAGAGYALSMVVAAWRRERQERARGAEPRAESEAAALRAELEAQLAVSGALAAALREAGLPWPLLPPAVQALPAPAPATVTGQDDGQTAAAVRSAARPGYDRGDDQARDARRPQRDRAAAAGTAGPMTAEAAREAVERLARRARRSGRQVTTEEVARLTGRQARQARRLLAAAQAAVAADETGGRPPRPQVVAGAAVGPADDGAVEREPERRPRVVELEAAPAAAVTAEEA